MSKRVRAFIISLVVAACAAAASMLVGCGGIIDPTATTNTPTPSYSYNLDYGEVMKDGEVIGYSFESGVVGGDFTVPDTYNGLPIVRIGYYALGGRKLGDVVLPDSVTEIGYAAFRDSSVRSIVMRGVADINAQAFYGCSDLESVTVGDGLKRIGREAFYGCSALTDCPLIDGVTTVESYAFAHCDSLSSVTVPASVTELGGNVFVKSGVRRAVICEGLTVVPNNTFCGCDNLTEVVLPSTVKTIGAYSFENCRKLQNVDIPFGVESIGVGAFRDSTLTSVTIPQTVRRIGDAAFYNNQLTELQLDCDCVNISRFAFNGTNYREIMFSANLPSFDFLFNGISTCVKDVVITGDGACRRTCFRALRLSNM